MKKKKRRFNNQQQQLQTRKNNITAATDNNGVDTAKDAGKNSIQSTQPATAVKSNAKMK